MLTPKWKEVENYLNNCLQKDVHFHEACHALVNKTLVCEITPFAWQITVYFDEKAYCHLSFYPNKHPDLLLAGNLPTLLGLALSTTPQEQKKWLKDMHLEGDLSLLPEIQALFKQIPLDWESLLANLLGDPLALGIMTAYDKMQKSLKAEKTAASGLLKEALEEEYRLIPSQIEMDYFLREVDELRDQAARIEARLRLLEEKL